MVGAGPRSGGLDVVGQGGNGVIRDGDLGGYRLNASGIWQRVDIINVRGDASEGPPRDVFNFSGKASRVVLSNCRFDGAHGSQTSTHGDDAQVTEGAEVDLFYVRDSTFLSAYQAIMLARRADGSGVKRIILENFNVRDRPDLRVQKSIAVLIDGCAERGCTLELRNCWIDGWPDGLERAIWTRGNVTVIGAFQQGIPPGGDFCP